jgi:hypothetical protein
MVGDCVYLDQSLADPLLGSRRRRGLKQAAGKYQGEQP